jgi:hypothetical protein
MNINNAFPSKYLKASDAEDGDLILTIAKVKIESIGQGAQAQPKPVLYFTENDKGFVCNKTNANLLTRYLGSADTDDWTGKKIRLVSAEVEFQGEPVMSLRVREMKKATKSAPVDVEPRTRVDEDDRIPF